MLWTCKSYGWYEQLRIPWDLAPRYYEPLKAMDNMKDFVSWTEASKYYEQLKDVDDMDYFGS